MLFFFVISLKSSLNSSIKGGFISFSLKWSSSYSAENSSKTGVIRTVEAALINLPDSVKIFGSSTPFCFAISFKVNTTSLANSASNSIHSRTYMKMNHC